MMMNAFLCVFNKLGMARAKEELLQNLEKKTMTNAQLCDYTHNSALPVSNFIQSKEVPL